LVTVHSAEPWCSECEWNLDRYEPDRHKPEFGWRWLDRTTHQLAYRLTARQYRLLAGRHVERPGWTLAKICLLVAAVLLLATVGGILILGSYLIVDGFPSLGVVPGTIFVLIALALRPRLGRLDPLQQRLDRGEAPTLFKLVDEVATTIGAPAPHVITVDADFNASADAVGLRRRRVLCLGLSLWGVLPPQQRVALLGHELGHFVNGDVRRGPLTHVAMTTLGTVAGLLRPPGMRARVDGLVGLLAELITGVVMGTLRFLVLCLHFLLVWLGLRDAQRAEYLADELAARAAGSAAAAALADTLTAAETMVMVVKREARQRGGASNWRAAADQARTDVKPRLSRLRQLSVRDDTSLFASHPPSGLRARMVESRSAQTPAVVLSETDSARIDQELTKAYEAARRDLAAT
jgi:Zn-dependent protease with chaperone function